MKSSIFGFGLKSKDDSIEKKFLKQYDKWILGRQPSKRFKKIFAEYYKSFYWDYLNIDIPHSHSFRHVSFGFIFQEHDRIWAFNVKTGSLQEITAEELQEISQEGKNEMIKT